MKKTYGLMASAIMAVLLMTQCESVDPDELIDDASLTDQTEIDAIESDLILENNCRDVQWQCAFGTLGTGALVYKKRSDDLYSRDLNHRDCGDFLRFNWNNEAYYTDGRYPSVTSFENRVVQVHQGDGSSKKIYYRAGSTGGGLSGGAIWRKAGYITRARYPEVDAKNGRIAIVYQGDDSHKIYYRIGQLRSDFSINWRVSSYFTRGRKPSVAVGGIGGARIVEVHMGDGSSNNMYYRLGTINTFNYSVSWRGGAYYTTGENPSVDINGDNLVVEAHEDKDFLSNKQYYRIGRLNSNNTITWTSAGGLPNGDNPSISIADEGIVQVVYDRGGDLWSRLGSVSEDGSCIYWRDEEIILDDRRQGNVDFN